MTTTLVLSPGIIVVNGVNLMEKYWKVSDLTTVTPDTRQEEEPKFLGYFFEDKNGEQIEEENIEVDKKIILVVETENAEGKSVKIDLNNGKLDFKHNGKILENDVLKGISITGEQTRVELTAIEEA